MTNHQLSSAQSLFAFFYTQVLAGVRGLTGLLAQSLVVQELSKDSEFVRLETIVLVQAHRIGHAHNQYVC